MRRFANVWALAVLATMTLSGGMLISSGGQAQDERVKNPFDGVFELIAAVPVELTEPVALNTPPGVPQEEAEKRITRVLLLHFKVRNLGHFLGMGARPDPIWYFGEFRADVALLDLPDVVLVVEHPDAPEEVVLWRFDPLSDSDREDKRGYLQPSPQTVKRLAATASEGKKPALSLKGVLEMDAPRVRVAPTDFQKLVRNLIERER